MDSEEKQRVYLQSIIDLTADEYEKFRGAPVDTSHD